MKADQPPAFLLDVDDWLTSARIAAMTAEEERAYFRLLMYQWKDPDCSLPDDDVLLSAMAKVPLDLWLNQIRTTLRVCFEPNVKGGSTTPPQSGQKWCNPRLLEERKRWATWREKSKRGGIKSGQVRKKKAHRTTLEPPFEHPSNQTRTKGQPKRSNSIPPHEEVVNTVGRSKKENNSTSSNGAPRENLSRFTLEQRVEFARADPTVTKPQGYARTILASGEHDAEMEEFFSKPRKRRIVTPGTNLP